MTTPDVPAELAAALADDGPAAAVFAGLPPSHRRAYTDWVGSAARPETRSRRAARAVEMLHAGRRP